MSFWEKLDKPFFCLAPMADVTDAAFRRIIVKYGKPDVLWTEFVSADGLVSEGKEALKKDLIYSKKEKPIVVQLFSANPKKIKKAAIYCASLGFDGVDINMGCPDRSIEKQGAGASLMKDYELSAKIIASAKESNLPVSVKTRVGYNRVQEDWIPFLLNQGLAALIIHARTRKEMSKVSANWGHIKRAVEIRNERELDTLIIGNGDVATLEQGRRLAKETGCDGIMIGRGIFGNPWLFSERIPTLKEKMKVMLEHTKMFNKLIDFKNFAVMKKHFKAYVNGFDGAKELRIKLMKVNSYKEVKKIIKDFLR
ncbi:MAG: tRNA-dihydrouridine synthase [Patescibacteria group bacterium]|nr:tRNA-dihydrouridine synthase [Patescibacteria group bacterium]